MSPTTADMVDSVKSAALMGLSHAQALLPLMLSPPISIIAPFLLFLVALAGYEVKSRDAERFRRVRGRFFSAGFWLLIPGIAGLAWATFASGDEAIDPFGFDIRNGVTALLAASFSSIVAGIGFALGGTMGGWGTSLRRGHSVVIAIDGPAASGKGTLAKRIADYYRLSCLDTGLLYRAVARDVLAAGSALEDMPAAIAAAKALDPATLDDEGLRTAAAGEAASVVAKYPDVRTALLAYQRDFAAKNKRGAVLDGRDIGTVVCPDADVKIYVTATCEERSTRRHKELEGRGETVTYEEVLEDIRKRDSRDVGRTVAPLWPAKDAIQLDTTKLDPDQAYKAALAIVKERLRVLSLGT